MQETEHIVIYWSVHTALPARSKDLHANLHTNLLTHPVWTGPKDRAKSSLQHTVARGGTVWFGSGTRGGWRDGPIGTKWWQEAWYTVPKGEVCRPKVLFRLKGLTLQTLAPNGLFPSAMLIFQTVCWEVLRTLLQQIFFLMISVMSHQETFAILTCCKVAMSNHFTKVNTYRFFVLGGWREIELSETKIYCDKLSDIIFYHLKAITQGTFFLLEIIKSNSALKRCNSLHVPPKLFSKFSHFFYQCVAPRCKTTEKWLPLE